MLSRRVLLAGPRLSTATQGGVTTSVACASTAAATESKAADGWSGKYPASLINVPVTKETTLKSGLRVATETSHGETATVGVWIDTGSRYENEDNNGTAHFLEHMAFKGTKTMSQSDLERKIENMGGHLNAYTSREQTVYFARVFKDHVPEAVSMLADILQNSTLDEKAIERERDVILREAEEVSHVVEEVVFDHLHAVAYQGTSLARPILGSEENIKSITRDDLVNYIETHYTAPRMVVAGAGAVDHDALVGLAEKAFANLPTSTQGVVAADAPRFTSGEMKARNDALGKCTFALAVEGVGWTNPDYFALMVAQCIVGSWDKAAGGGSHLSSKLAQIVSENHLADSFVSFNTCYKDTGLWGVLATAGHDQLDDIVYVIEQEWVRLAFSPAEKEVERAKNQLKTALLMQLDDTSSVCEDVGRQFLNYRRRLTPVEIFARIDAISPDDIKRVANDYFYNKSPTLAAVGTTGGLPDYARIEAWNYWARV